MVDSNPILKIKKEKKKKKKQHHQKPLPTNK